MSDPYEEVIEGETVQRLAPGERHEQICQRLHSIIAGCLPNTATSRLLECRAVVQLSPGTLVRPDLTLVTAANGRPWLIAEIIDSDDHRADTVTKKNLYEELNIPRLWMVDPRYNNVETYRSSQYGLALVKILAGREILSEKLLPGLQLTVSTLFATKESAV